MHYCAEGPADDESDRSAIAEKLKRFRASEYEREPADRQRHTAGTPASPDAANEDAGIVGSDCFHRLAQDCSRQGLPSRAFLCDVSVRERA